MSSTTPNPGELRPPTEEEAAQMKKTAAMFADRMVQAAETCGMVNNLFYSLGLMSEVDTLMAIQGILLGSLSVAAKARAHIQESKTLQQREKDAICAKASAYFVTECEKAVNDHRAYIAANGG